MIAIQKVLDVLLQLAGGVHSRVGKGQAEQHGCSRGLATTALATLEPC